MTNPIINPELARFAANLNDLWAEFCERPENNRFFELFAPAGIRLFTGDGYTAQFYEEGIQFYPTPKEEQ